jgi:cysteinyl-tRNA synthetase
VDVVGAASPADIADIADVAVDGILKVMHQSAASATSVAEQFKAEFDAAIFDDLNIPKALGVAWNAVRYPQKTVAIFELLLDMDAVFGLGLKEAGERADKAAKDRAQTGVSFIPDLDGGDLPAEVAVLLEERAAARAAKDFIKSDEIRDRLKQLGYEVKDTKGGAVVYKAG